MFITTTLPWKSSSRKVLLSNALISRSRSVSGKKSNAGGGAGRGSGSAVSDGCTGATGCVAGGELTLRPD
jgi:hypothetical protein